MSKALFPVDPQTVSNLVEKLASARRAVIVGNGGIALSIVHEVRSIDLAWDRQGRLYWQHIF